MNSPTIDTARDADLRLSQQALRRAAKRAWDLALQTGTAIVISRNGMIEHIQPSGEPAAQQWQEPFVPDAKKP